MFGVYEAISALHWSLAMQEHEREAEKRFAASIADLPADQQAELIRVRSEAKEKARREREIERRHQELCQAIRDSRPRGLGLFF